jgi:hypothetical protein
VAQLYPQTLGSLFVAYHSQDYDGGIRTPFHAAALTPGKGYRYPLDKRLDVSQSRSGRCG